ncbi:MAG: hypothetical protein PHY59_03440 [Methanobacterium sp.]|nr:hypothetical protein [Methanobacterium sp.]
MDENINNGVKVDGYYEYKHPFIQELATILLKILVTPKIMNSLKTLNLFQILKIHQGLIFVKQFLHGCVKI